MDNSRRKMLAEDAARCKAVGVPFDPKLPKNFDDTPNEDRPASHQRWWHCPFISIETDERMDHFYATRTDEFAEVGRKHWKEERVKWLEEWPTGVRYDVRCLDGGAWDRSTFWGAFATLDEALHCALNGGAGGFLDAAQKRTGGNDI